MKTTILSLLLVILAGCTKDNYYDRFPYYKFDTSDITLISKYNYSIGQIITYENQFGDKLHFKVISNETKKFGDYSHGTFSGGGGILESYYDGKIIRFEIIENQANFTEEQVCYIFSKSENNFKNGIKFPIWNFEEFTFFDEIDRPYNIDLREYINYEKKQMNVNGHLFEKVIIIDSGNDIPKPNSWGAILPNNVNQLYYDYDFGIIQFNDIDGKQWKLIYPI